jgi:4a-hydroxytetrahydrobiopterin dehydratase
VSSPQKCVPCEGGIPPLKDKELDKYMKKVKGWKLIQEHHIEKEFDFPDFRKALGFVNKVGDDRWIVLK